MRRSAWIYIATLALTGGCAATTTIDEYRPSTAQMEIGSGEKVVILGRHDAGHYDTDGDFVNCVASKMDGGAIHVLPEQDFIDSVYPWFEPRTAPKSLSRLKRLIEEPFVREKVNKLDVRYLVWLDGTTQTTGKAGSMSCSLGPAGGGCLGFTQWDKTSVYEAIVWDLDDLTEKGRIRVDSEGTSYLIGVVAPIPLLSPVKRSACSGIGNQLKSYFSDGIS